MAKTKPTKKKAKTRKKTNWYDLGNEVMDGAATIAKGAWREVTMHPKSLNQRAMGKVADVATAGAAIGSVVGGGAMRAAGTVYDLAESGLERAHDRAWGDDRHGFDKSKRKREG